MSSEANKALVRRFYDEVFNQQNRATAAEILAPDFVAHHPAFPDGIRGPEGIVQTVAAFRSGFPDLHYTIDDLFAEGDKVGVRWTGRGTHQGEFLNMAPTGKAMTYTGTDVFRVARGQCAEAWVSADVLGLLQQLGAIPSPGEKASPR
ncbi:MAG TPA: ester cyclase [Candidatus Binatia bacterium]|jgi:steroid delta-isomerase-like uncharacterized protein|nr:ester cyclase [Candidatus Binatia bacterium]